MLILSQRFLTVLLEILCCKAFFESFAERRQGRDPWKQNALLLALSFCSCFVFSFTAPQFLLQRFLGVGAVSLSGGFSPVFAYVLPVLFAGRVGDFSMAFMLFLCLQQLLYVAAVGMCMWLCLQVKLVKSLCFTIAFQILLFMADAMGAGLYVFLFHRIYLMRDICHRGGSLIVILGRCVLFFFLLLMWRIRRKPLHLGGKGKWRCPAGQWTPFFLCAALAVLLAWGSVRPDGMEGLYFASSFAFVSLAVLVLYLVDGLLKREGKAYKKAMFRMKAQNQADLYHTLSENYEKQQKKVHEYKNQILCIESLLRRKMYQELEEYVSAISGGLGESLDHFQTNHPIADAIINRAYQEMLEKGILFVPKFSDLSGLWIADGDLVAILSNLLENAIEACEKYQGRKMIKMKFIVEEGGMVLSVKNTYNGNVEIKDGEIQSTKTQNPKEHGLGLKNVMEIVEGYHGSYAIRTEGGEFYISILAPKAG